MVRTANDEPPEADAAPGTFCWRSHAATDYSPASRYLLYVCPKGSGYCGVPVSPGKLPNGASWQHNGNDEKPTLTPSVNCTGGCGWHGFITNGEMKGA
jgi:hypothetical protein